MGIIGKRFQDVGLLDLLVESGIAGSAVVRSAMQGRQYNRAVCFHRIVAEALERLCWQQFVTATDISSDQVSEVCRVLENLQTCITGDNLRSVTTCGSLQVSEVCRVLENLQTCITGDNLRSVTTC